MFLYLLITLSEISLSINMQIFIHMLKKKNKKKLGYFHWCDTVFYCMWYGAVRCILKSNSRRSVWRRWHWKNNGPRTVPWGTPMMRTPFQWELLVRLSLQGNSLSMQGCFHITCMHTYTHARARPLLYSSSDPIWSGHVTNRKCQNMLSWLDFSFILKHYGH